MNWKSFIFGTAIGMISGYAVNKVLTQKVAVSSEKALDYVKNHFKELSSIKGSWIFSEAQPYKKENINYLVYKGGISKVENGVSKQYEFIVDANKGTLLDVHPA